MGDERSRRLAGRLLLGAGELVSGGRAEQEGGQMDVLIREKETEREKKR